MKVAIKQNAFLDFTTNAILVGYNPITKRFLVCNDNGNLIHYNSIHKPTGEELNNKEYKQLETEIKKIVCEQLAKELPAKFRI